MDHCCDRKGEELQKLRLRQGRVLKVAFAINLTLFFIEMISGWLSHSNSLVADSLDMLGDAIIYLFSLYVLHRGDLWKNRAALAKGLLMGALGVGVVANTVIKHFSQSLPVAETMGVVGTLALVANALTFWILLKHRSDDLNMRSTWLCSRNDIIANLGVLMAGGLVAITHSALPDMTVALIISSIILHSAFSTIRESMAALKAS